MCQIRDVITSMKETSKLLYDKPRTGLLDVPSSTLQLLMNML